MSTEKILFWLIFALIVALIMLIVLGLVKEKHKRKRTRKLSKKKSNNIVFADYEIRYIPITGEKPHPAYVYYVGKKKGKAINTTHKPPRRKKSTRISHNPDPNDNRKTYAVKEIQVFDVKKSGRDMHKKGWYYHPKDIKKMNAIIRKEDK